MMLLKIIVVFLPFLCLVHGVGYRYRANPVTGEKVLVLHVPGSGPSIQTEFPDSKFGIFLILIIISRWPFSTEILSNFYFCINFRTFYRTETIY